MGTVQLADWSQLATLAGAAGVVAVVVSFIKSLSPWFEGNRTLLLAWVLSLVICLFAAARTASEGQRADYVLAVINSFLIAATAAGMREGQRSIRGLNGAGGARAAGGDEPAVIEAAKSHGDDGG
jgi:hypothetical protein